MVDHLKTDEEKAEELKAWWRDNGTSIVAGVVLAVVGLFGWEYWKNYQITSIEEASLLYSQAQQAASADEAATQLNTLREDYASTPYASMASLQSAKQYAESGEYEKSAAALQWVIDNTKDPVFNEVARLRLARVWLAMDNTADALSLVEQEYSEAYQSLREEIRGDIYKAQNKPLEARQAYERAISSNTDGSSELIQLKMDNLGQS